MGKQIFITGVTRGLGKAMLEEFSSLGHVVYGCARNKDSVRKLNDDYGEDRFLALDISDADAVLQCANQMATSGFVPDLVLNNAGLINANAPLWNVSPEEFQQVINVNVVGTYAVIRAFLPAMMKRGSGGFVNFSSTWGRTTSPEVAPYCASKFAIEGLAKAFASELTGELFAVALNPGVINTEMLQSTFGNAAQNHIGPFEWAKTVVPFLLNLGPRDNGASLDSPY